MDLFQKCKELYEKIRYFEYGIPVDGVIKPVPSAEYYVKNYHFLKPEEFEKYKGGICWDYVEYERKFLEVNDIDFNQYYLITNTPPNYDTHTFITVKDGDELIYIESSFKRVEHIIDGVQKFKSLEDIVKLITTNMWYCNDNDKHFDEFKYDVCKFKGHPKYGCTCEEYMKWMDDNSDIVIQDVTINPKKVNEDELAVEEFSVNKIDTKFTQFVCESANDPEEYDETLHDHIADEDDVYNESSVLKFPKKVNNVPFDIMYFGSNIDFGNESIKLDHNELFLTPYIGLASIFITDRKEYFKPLPKDRPHNTNIGYDEWGLSPSELQKPLKEVHVSLDDIPNVTPFEFDYTGYIYAIDVSQYKNNLYQKDWMTSDREFILKNINPVPIKEKIKWTHHVYVRGKNTDDVYNESYIGEATVPSGKVAFLYKKWSTKNKEQFNTLDVFWDIINKYIKDHNIPISNVCGYGTDWTGYGTDFVYGIFFKNQQTIPNDLLETMKKKIPDIKVKDLNIPTKFDGYETCPNNKMEQTYDKIWDKGFLMYELEEYPDDDTIKIHYKYKVLYSENEEWNKRWEEYKKNKKPVSINESWTDFKNGVHPSSGLMFHVSLKNDMDGKTITPQLPSYITDGGELDDNYREDTKTKRLCVSPSIEGCLIAILSYKKIREHAGDKFYVYTPEKPFSQYKHKTNKEIVKDKLVFDANITKEAWILEPCKLKLYGIIKLKKVKDLKKKATVEKNIKMNTIKLDYEWIMTPKASGKFNKAIGDSSDEEDTKEKPIKEYAVPGSFYDDIKPHPGGVYALVENDSYRSHFCHIDFQGHDNKYLGWNAPTGSELILKTQEVIKSEKWEFRKSETDTIIPEYTHIFTYAQQILPIIRLDKIKDRLRDLLAPYCPLTVHDPNSDTDIEYVCIQPHRFEIIDKEKTSYVYDTAYKEMFENHIVYLPIVDNLGMFEVKHTTHVAGTYDDNLFFEELFYGPTISYKLFDVFKDLNSVTLYDISDINAWDFACDYEDHYDEDGERIEPGDPKHPSNKRVNESANVLVSNEEFFMEAKSFKQTIREEQTKNTRVSNVNSESKFKAIFKDYLSNIDVPSYPNTIQFKNPDKIDKNVISSKKFDIDTYRSAFTYLKSLYNKLLSAIKNNDLVHSKSYRNKIGELIGRSIENNIIVIDINEGNIEINIGAKTFRKLDSSKYDLFVHRSNNPNLSSIKPTIGTANGTGIFMYKSSVVYMFAFEKTSDINKRKKQFEIFDHYISSSYGDNLYLYKPTSSNVFCIDDNLMKRPGLPFNASMIPVNIETKNPLPVTKISESELKKLLNIEDESEEKSIKEYDNILVSNEEFFTESSKHKNRMKKFIGNLDHVPTAEELKQMTTGRVDEGSEPPMIDTDSERDVFENRKKQFKSQSPSEYVKHNTDKKLVDKDNKTLKEYTRREMEAAGDGLMSPGYSDEGLDPNKIKSKNIKKTLKRMGYDPKTRTIESNIPDPKDPSKTLRTRLLIDDSSSKSMGAHASRDIENPTIGIPRKQLKFRNNASLGITAHENGHLYDLIHPEATADMHKAAKEEIERKHDDLLGVGRITDPDTGETIERSTSKPSSHFNPRERVADAIGLANTSKHTMRNNIEKSMRVFDDKDRRTDKFEKQLNNTRFAKEQLRNMDKDDSLREDLIKSANDDAESKYGSYRMDTLDPRKNVIGKPDTSKLTRESCLIMDNDEFFGLMK